MEEKEEISKDIKQKLVWIGLWSMICLLLCSNLALLIYIQGQKKNWNLWKEEKKQHQENIKSQAFLAMSEWQAELAVFSSLEEAYWMFSSSQKEKALEVLKSLDTNNFPIIIFFRALLEHNLGMNDSAVHSWTKYLEEMPHSIYARWYRSQIYLSKKDWENARNDLIHLLELRPEFSPATTLLENFPLE